MSQENQSSPFRQRALEHIATPQPLDDFVQVTSPLAWVLLVAIWLIIATVITWLILGTVVTHVDGKGIVISDNESIIYFSAAEGQNVQTGMRVEVNPRTVKQWEARGIVGKITAVDYVPQTPQNIQDMVKNQSLVSYFLQQGPVLLAHVSLRHDADTSSHYAYAPGVLVEERITTRRERPLSYLIPFFQRFFRDRDKK